MARRKSSRRDNKSGQIVEDGKYFRARLEIGRDVKTGRPQYKTVRCISRAQAVDALAKLITDYGMGSTTPTERGNFGQFLDQWLATSVKPTKSANTYRQYEWLVRFHIKPHLGTKQTDRVARNDIQKLLSAKASQTLAPRDKEQRNITEKSLSTNTLRLIHACLHSALEEAKRHGLATKNAADSIDLPRKAKGAKKQFLTPQETEAFMKKIDDSDLADFFAFMIATGTRIGEASGLRWEDLDFSTPARPLVWIRGQLQRVEGKLVYVQGTKTNQERCLPLSRTIAERLQTKRLVLGKDDGFVFKNSEGRPIDPKHANLRLAELCKEARVPTISAHKLRHTAATLMLAESGDLHAVQKALGHSQVALTSNLYGHATAETLRPVMSKLDRIFERE